MPEKQPSKLIEEVKSLPSGTWRHIGTNVFANTSISITGSKPFRYVVSAAQEFVDDPLRYRIVKLDSAFKKLDSVELDAAQTQEIDTAISGVALEGH
jgi:hypothetical protein